MGGAPGGIAIGGANMWALLLDKDPGHSAAASGLAVDVVDRKLKKTATVTAVVEVEEAPPAGNVGKPAKAKRGDKAKKNKKSAAGSSKQAPANVDDGMVQIDGAADSEQLEAPTAVPELVDGLVELEETLATMPIEEAAEEEEAKEAMFDVVKGRGGRGRTVGALARTRKAAPVEEGVATGGVNMWALLLDKDPGHSAAAGGLAVDVVDRKLKKAAAVIPLVLPVEVAKPAKRGNNMVKKEKKSAVADSKQAAAPAATVGSSGTVPINGAGDSKQAAAPATVPDGDELASGLEEIREALAALLRKEEAEEKEAREAMFNVVAARGGRRRTVTSKAAVVAEGVTTVTGTNMWAVLNDDDPGHDDAKLANKSKKTKTKTKNKKAATGGSEQAAATVDDKETPASELVEEMSAEEEELAGEAATSGSRCRTVISRVCKAAVAVAMLALYFQLASTPPTLA